MDCHIFCLRNNRLAMLYKFTEDHEDLFQGNFTNNKAYGWRDL